MSYQLIQKALIQSYVDLALGIPTAYENVDFDPSDVTYLNYDTQTGDFTDQLTVTGATSGATGVICADDDNGVTGVLALITTSGTFVNDEIITDTSTGSASVNGAPSSKGATQFIDISTIPASTEVITKDSLDEEIGVYQISIYTRSGTSSKTSYDLADTIALNYKHGTKLTSGAQKVFISRTSRNGGRNLEGWFIIDLSINYIADLLR
jgi:hypothetical protein